MTAVTVAAAVVVALALAAITTAAALSIIDDRRVRRTDDLVDRMRADKTLETLAQDHLGDDVVRMLAAWRDESGS